MDTVLGELHARSLGAAERMMRLSIDHGLGVTALMAALARDLVELDARHWQELATADERDRLRLRAEHARRIAERLVAGAVRMAELGSEVRSGFSRLLTEQLAAGNHGLMDAFQGFFAVLPPSNLDFQRMVELAGERTGRALAELSALLAPPAPPAPATAAPLPPKRPRLPARAKTAQLPPLPPPSVPVADSRAV